MSYGTVQAEKMTTESGYSLGAGNATSFKNRVINGGMVIDQRNNGAVVTPTDNAFTLDRWAQRVSGTGVYTVQQSTTVPTGQGFINSILATVTTADSSIAAGDIYSFLYKLEGYNTSDLMWGTASAKTATLSFWVRSSQTGTYSVGFTNIAANRGYAATYTINSADTWEYKTITVPGDTTGTWNSNNLCSIQISFCLGCGTDRTEPAGSWSGNNVQGADGTFNWMANSGATFYMTGVQFEVGTVATSFDFRSYGTELALCQRYFELAIPVYFVMSKYDSTRSYGLVTTFKVQKRSNPTFNYTGTNIQAHGSGQGGYTNTTLTTDTLNVYSHTGYIGLGAYGSYFCGLDGGSVFQYSSEL